VRSPPLKKTRSTPLHKNVWLHRCVCNMNTETRRDPIKNIAYEAIKTNYIICSSCVYTELRWRWLSLLCPLFTWYKLGRFNVLMERLSRDAGHVLYNRDSTKSRLDYNYWYRDQTKIVIVILSSAASKTQKSNKYCRKENYPKLYFSPRTA